ncbi:hypothetical protein PENANT_c003G10100 [Penicillium antarcticum]|uniref:C2H2-type domain-containing protein n=1 Tax=Penicillium antarcticum TaxID=416450 RepID=A0A1V6PVK1_9EURO|nr:hypothetical protein PENANT_c031G11150 [Penicillium antarcticum]OQD80991.1 hypothetical protein PENANT_c030G02791 [Penicillium antarcticum]OQD81106.1 hypothetical protein PENANT_c029G02849 [Penicillium antarcticum]OQD88668.1 hypothetical protein PENANT_c003G10100 [Penicillium antarcticum]
MSAFLGHLPSFQRYLEGDNTLPNYDVDANGNIVLMAGEVFCRVPGCTSSNFKFSNTGNLRNHLKTHASVSLAPAKKAGRYTNESKMTIAAWYNQHFGPPAKPRIPFTVRGEISVKEVKKHLATKHVVTFPCGACASKQGAKCPITPYTCAYLTRYFDVAADFDKDDYPELDDIDVVAIEDDE